MFFENPDGTMNFVDVNDNTQLCKAYIIEQLMDNFLNIITGTGIIFHHYERMLVEFFPVPRCQVLTFNIPSLLRHANNILYYEAYPRITAFILNKYTIIPSFCTYLVHNVPQKQFEQPLDLVAKIVSTRLSVSHEILVRNEGNDPFYTLSHVDVRGNSAQDSHHRDGGAPSFQHD